MAAAAAASTASVCSSLSITTLGYGKGKTTPTSGQPTKPNLPCLNLYDGLKAQTKVMMLGSPESTEKKFGQMRAKCYAKSARGQGGAAALRCDVASEILTVVPIMSVLVLVGIALGFVLLRIEAALEENET